MVVLRDGQGAVQHHPVNQVGHLAYTAANAAFGSALGNGQSFLVALFRGGSPHQLPEGEGLAGMNDNTDNFRRGKAEVHRFILLQAHIHIACAESGNCAGKSQQATFPPAGFLQSERVLWHCATGEADTFSPRKCGTPTAQAHKIVSSPFLSPHALLLAKQL